MKKNQPDLIEMMADHINSLVQDCENSQSYLSLALSYQYPDSKVHGANMGPTWVLSAPDGPHVGPMNLAIRVYLYGRLMCHQTKYGCVME